MKTITKENETFAKAIATRLNKRLNIDKIYNKISVIKSGLDGYKDNENIQLSFDIESFSSIIQSAEIYIIDIDRWFIVTETKDGYDLQENLNNGEIIYFAENEKLCKVLDLLDAILIKHKEKQTCLSFEQYETTKALILSMQVLYDKCFVNESDKISILLDEYLNNASDLQRKDLETYQNMIISKLDNKEI